MAEHPEIIDNLPPVLSLVERIRQMPNEFNFCVNCLNTALNDPTTDNRNWTSSFNVPESQEPHRFTESVRRALLRLMAVDASVTACTFFESWFVDNRVTKLLAMTLLDALTTSYLLRQFQGYDFLRHCAVMAELSALCFFAGVVETPDYAVGCILYVIKDCVIKNTFDWDSVSFNAECLSKSGEDPNVHFQKLMNTRRALLEGYTSE